MTAQYTQNDARKMIIQNVATSIGTGFNTLFSDMYTDSLERVQVIQDFTHAARFMDDESGYVFVETNSGYYISHPVYPELEGTTTLDQSNEYIYNVVLQMINISQNIGFGFLEYDYENPANQNTERKTSFIKSIPVASWYLGTGFYHTEDEPYLTSLEVNELTVRHSVEAMANGLGALYNSHIADSLHGAELMQKFLSHIRFFDNQSGYFFVISFSGYNIVQPPDPDFQGTYELDIQDSRGTYLVRGLIEAAQNGGGFFEYYWENYQSGNEEPKKAYVKQIPGQNYLIGSGVYLN